MPASTTFYSFAATLIPGLLFGTVRAALTPRTIAQRAQELIHERIPLLREAAAAGYDAGTKYTLESDPEAAERVAGVGKQNQRRQKRESLDEIVSEAIVDMGPEARREASEHLRIQAVAIVAAFAVSLLVEGAALYGAVVGNPGAFIRDTVVAAVLAGMTAAALAGFWPWIRHLSKRSQAVGGAGVALALALSMFLVLNGFAIHAQHEAFATDEKLEAIERRLTAIDRRGESKLNEYTRLEAATEHAHGTTRARIHRHAVEARHELEEYAREEDQENKALDRVLAE